MASYYIYSGAGGAGTGADWANAFTSLNAALNAVGMAAGDIFYVAHDHVESGGLGIPAGPGTRDNPLLFFCVNRSGSVPPVAADLRTTASIAKAGMTIAGNNVFDGIIFESTNGAISVGSTTPTHQIFRNCSFRLSSAFADTVGFGNSSSGVTFVELVNTTFQFNITAQAIIMRICNFIWRDTPSALGGAAVPTTLFTGTSSKGSHISVRGVDLSAAGSGKTLMGVTGTFAYSALFQNCKLNASVTRVGTIESGVQEVDFVNCDSSVNYRSDRFRYPGSQTVETTIVRTGGASDGTTPISWKIDTNANVKWANPYVCPPIAVWNETIGSSVNVAIEGVWGGGAVPNDDEIWVEVEYLGDSGSPKASFANDSKATPLTSAAGQSAGSGSWGGGTTQFKLDVSVTPQKKGWLLIYVKAAKASSTFYIDPKAVIS